MAQAIATATKSLKFWLALLFFSLPLVAMPLLDAHGEETEFKPWSIQRYVADGDGWIPAPMDATTDGTIIIRKVAYPRDTVETFTFTGDVSGTIGNGGTLTSTDLAAPGTYFVEEVQPPGWYTRSIQCDDDDTYSTWWSSQIDINLGAAETVECTFYNVEQGSEGCRETAGLWPYGSTSGVAVSGNLAYVGSGAGFQVLNISNPAAPFLVGAVPLDYLTEGVTYSNGYAYVAQRYYGVAVVDVTDPNSPTYVTTITGPQYTRNTFITGNALLIAGGYNGLHIYDITDPTTPSFLGQIDPGGFAWDVVVVGTLAYLANSDGGLRVLDIGNPAAPTEIGFVILPSSARAVDVAMDVAYVASSDGEVRMVDVSVPSSPSEVGSITPSRGANWVDVHGSYAYVGGWGLTILDISSPANPVEIGSANPPGNANRLHVAGNVVYYPGTQSGLSTLNVSVPSAPAVIGSFTNPIGASDIKIDSGYAYLALGYDGDLVVMDVSTASDPTVISQMPISAERVDVADGYAYVTGDYYNVQIVDIADPFNPYVAAAFYSPASPGYPLSVDVAGDYAYVAFASDGLRIVDVADPLNPIEVGHVDTPGFAGDVSVFGSNAYIADGDSGLRIIDVGNPYAPVEVGFYDTPGWVRDVEFRDGLTFLADDTAGLVIIDVGDPMFPVLLGSQESDYGANPTRVSLMGNLAYVSTYSGVNVYDISDPASPLVIDRLLGQSSPSAVDTWGGRVFVPQNEIVLEILQPCDLLFADDFETGDSQLWANAVGGP